MDLEKINKCRGKKSKCVSQKGKGMEGGENRQERNIVKVTAEKKSLLVRQLEACQCVSECLCMCAWTYWSLKSAVFWHLCSKLQLLSVSERPPLEQLYLRPKSNYKLELHTHTPALLNYHNKSGKIRV